MFSISRLETYVPSPATVISNPETYVSSLATIFFAAKVQKSFERQKDLLGNVIDNGEKTANVHHVLPTSEPTRSTGGCV
jgi:hypothetical protein